MDDEPNLPSQGQVRIDLVDGICAAALQRRDARGQQFALAADTRTAPPR